MFVCIDFSHILYYVYPEKTQKIFKIFSQSAISSSEGNPHWVAMAANVEIYVASWPRLERLRGASGIRGGDAVIAAAPAVAA